MSTGFPRQIFCSRCSLGFDKKERKRDAFPSASTISVNMHFNQYFPIFFYIYFSQPSGPTHLQFNSFVAAISFHRVFCHLFVESLNTWIENIEKKWPAIADGKSNDRKYLFALVLRNEWKRIKRVKCEARTSVASKWPAISHTDSTYARHDIGRVWFSRNFAVRLCPQPFVLVFPTCSLDFLVNSMHPKMQSSFHS